MDRKGMKGKGGMAKDGWEGKGKGRMEDKEKRKGWKIMKWRKGNVN